jgi:hypothetical protein
MNLCSNGHEEICFEGHDCPACAVTEDRDARIVLLEERVEELKDRISDLESDDE